MKKPVFRCSSLDRVLNCHGSATLEPLVRPRKGDEGFEGSCGHYTVARRLIEEFGALAPEGGLLWPDIPKDYKLPKMSEWIVDWFLRLVRDEIPAKHALSVEGSYVYEFDRFILSGHPDVEAINADGTDFHGLDEKWGYKAVLPAEFNWQIMGYLCLAKRAYPKLGHARYLIGQPRNSEEDGFSRVSQVELDGGQLDNCLATLNDKMNEALDDPMTVNSGMSQCAWCPVGIQCPSVRAEIEFMKSQLTPESLAAIRATADDSLLGDIIISARSINRAIEDAETMLKERIALNGQVMAGQGVRITAKEEGGQYKNVNPLGAWEAVKSLIPEERRPYVLKYSSDMLIDEIAEAQKIPKGGNGPVTGRKLFQSVIAPNFDQGKRVKLLFS